MVLKVSPTHIISVEFCNICVLCRYESQHKVSGSLYVCLIMSKLFSGLGEKSFHRLMGGAILLTDGIIPSVSNMSPPT